MMKVNSTCLEDYKRKFMIFKVREIFVCKTMLSQI